MPREGYRTICVTDEVYSYIQTKAKETNRTIPEYIKHLIEKDDSAPQPTSATSNRQASRSKTRKSKPA